MKKLLLFLSFLLLVTATAYAQVHRDTDGDSGSSFDLVAAAVGLVVGLVIGYLLGSRTRKP